MKKRFCQFYNFHAFLAAASATRLSQRRVPRLTSDNFICRPTDPMTSVSAGCIRLTQNQPVIFKSNCCTHLANAAKEWLIDLEPRCKSVEKKTSIFNGLNEEFSAGGKKVYCDNKFKRV